MRNSFTASPVNTIVTPATCCYEAPHRDQGFSAAGMLPIHVINLDRSADRWEAIERSRGFGLDIRRVAGIDGRAVGSGDRVDVDIARFRRCHGREMLPGEYGCYRSHLRALEIVAASPEPLAIIAEDDVTLPADLPDRVAAVFSDAPEIGLLKLVNHRTTAFRATGRSSEGDEYGRCLHGPQGSAAAYALTRASAARLREALGTMWLPWDIALERGWATGVATFTTREPLVSFPNRHGPSLIADSARYARTKPSPLQRMPTLAFRAVDYLRRIQYGLRR
ncbi:MAG: glycosyltransferase family 25 protein [Rhizobiaceae bacterium]|nr:glycosyltransferase family 25 protein [Rhizobiaceae bacterium]